LPAFFWEKDKTERPALDKHMHPINDLVRGYMRRHFRRVARFMAHPEEAQEQVLRGLLDRARHTEWGRAHGFAGLGGAADFRERVPIGAYEDLKPYIHRMMMGERDVLWPGRIGWFSKSSGTTGDKSKFIPVPDENLRGCHLLGGHDAMSMWFHTNPGSRLFAGGKGLIMGGSHAPFAEMPSTQIGDVSALMLRHMPFYARFFHTPDLATALMGEWEAKIERMAHIAVRENITNVSGVPTWTLVLFRRILEITGKSHLLEVFPRFELYLHGGVSFRPYREQFARLLPDPAVQYREVYNASEGFFAAQLEAGDEGMLLLLDNGVYFEFLPLEELGREQPVALPLEAVETGRNYAVVISTNAGLWRYLLGDTVRFTSVRPYRVAITGRTKHFINAFGEEVMVENTDRALAQTCRDFGASVREYTVAPIYMDDHGKGGHEWLVEFDRPPADPERFADALDLNLQALNSDYEAKRYKNMALQRLVLRAMPPDTFFRWLKGKGRFGGQIKVPRLSNDRTIVEEILSLGTE
jgi:hypothetical protein